jgi:hypothetical protein
MSKISLAVSHHFSFINPQLHTIFGKPCTNYGCSKRISTFSLNETLNDVQIQVDHSDSLKNFLIPSIKWTFRGDSLKLNNLSKEFWQRTQGRGCFSSFTFKIFVRAV